MASKVKRIDVQAFNTLEATINKVYNSLNVLDLKLNGDIVKRFYEISKGVNLFTNAIQKLGEINGNKLNASVLKVDTLFKAINLVADRAKDIPKADLEPLTSFSNGLYRLQLALDKLGNNEFDGEKLDRFKDQLRSLVSIPTEIPLPPNFGDYVKGLKSFGKLGDVFDALGAIKDVPLDETSPVGKFFNSLLKLAVTTRDISFNTSLFKIVNDVSTLFKAFANSPIEKTNLNVEAMDRAFQYVQTFFRRIVELAAGASFTTVLKAGTLFPALTNVLDPIFNFFIKLSSAKVTSFAVDQISTVFTQALTDVQKMFGVLIEFGKSASLFQVYKFRVIMQPLLDIMDDVTEIFSLVARKSFDSSKLGALGAVFDSVTDLLITLVDFASDITTKIGIFGTLKLGYLIGKFTGIFAQITELLRVVGAGKKGISKEVETFNFKGSKANATITVTDIQAIVAIFENVNLLFQQMTSINFGNGKVFSLSLKGLFEGISGITSAISGFIRFTVFSKFIRTYLADITGLVGLAKDVNPASLAALGDIFKSLVPILGQMIEFNTVMNALKGGINKAAGALTLGRSLDATINAVKSVLFIAKDINPENVKGVGEIFKGMSLMFPAYADFTRAVNEALKGGVVTALTTLPIRLAAMALTIRSILHFVREVVGLTADIPADKTAAIGEFAKGLGTLFQGLGSAFRAVGKETSQIGDLKSLLKYLVGVELLIYPIRRVVSALLGLTKGADPAFLTAAGTFVRSVAQALLGVSKAFEQAKYLTPDLGTILKTLFVFNKIINPIKDVARIMAQLPKGADFTGGAAYITAVSKFLTRMFKLFTDPAFIKADPANAKNVKGFIDDIVKVLKAINIPAGAFKNAEALTQFADKFDKVKNLDEVFKGLASGLNAVKGVDAGNVSPIFKALGDGLVEFSKALSKLTPAEVDRLERLSKVLKDLPAGGLDKALAVGGKSTQGLTEVRDLSEDVAQGMQRANFRAALFHGALSLIGSAFNALDPRRPIQLIIDGFSRAGQLVADLKATVFQAFDSIKQLGERMSSIGNTIKTNFGIENITNSDIFKTSIDFDKLGSSLEVFGGLTKEQRKEAEEFANVLGKDYPLSANEALKATLDLVKAGQGFESAQTILPAAADLAALSDTGSIENATAFIIQANATFKEFNDTTKASYENSALAVDIIAAAADSSTASVESLAEGLANVGPVASQFGLNLEETSAILAIFTDGGIAGAEAGTQLKSFLSNLTTKTAQKELRNLGISVTDASGNFKPMNDILNEIQKKFTQTGTVTALVTKQLAGPDAEKLKLAEKALASSIRSQFLLENDLNATGLGKQGEKKLAEAKTIAENASRIMQELGVTETEMQRITYDITRNEKQNAESLKKIAGSYGQSGLAILLAQGEDGLANFVAQMREVEPASVRAKQALDNISGDIIQLQGSVETLGTKALVPLLEKFFRPFVQLARFVVDSFLAIDESVINFTSTAVALGTAFATVAGSVLVLTGGLIQLGGASSAVFTFLAIGSKLMTVGLLAGITGLVAGIATLTAGFLILTPILTAITAGFNALVEIFSKNLGGATTQLVNLFQNIGGALTEVATGIGYVIQAMTALLTGDAQSGLQSAGEGFASFFNSISLSVTKFRTSGVGKTLIDVGALFKGVYETMSLGAKEDAAVAAVADTIESANRLPAAAAKARKAVAKSYAEMVVTLTKNNSILQGLFGKDVTVDEITGTFDTILNAMSVVRARIGDVFGSFGKAFENAKLAFNAEGGGFGKAISVFFSSLKNNLDDSVGDLAGTLLKFLGRAFNFDANDLAKEFSTKGFVSGAKKVFSKALAAIGDFLVSNRDGIKGMLTFVFDKLFLGSFNLAKTIADLLGLEQVSGILGDVIGAIRGVFGGVFDTIVNITEGQGITEALTNAFGPGIAPFLALVQSLGTAVDNIVGLIGTLFKSIFSPPEGVSASQEPFLLQLFNGVVTGLTSVIDFLNNNILNFLKTGDIAGLINNLVTSIGATINTLDLPTKFTDAATSILNGLVSAVQSAFSAVTGALNLDPTGFLTSVETSLTNFFDTVRNVFGGADGVSIFDNIVTIVDKLKVAFDAIFAVFASTNASTVETRGPSLQSVLANLFTMLGTTSGAIIDTITDLTDGLDKLISALALLNPTELLAFTSAMAITGGILALYAGGPAILTAFGTGFTTFSAGLTKLANSMAAKFAAFIVILEFVRAITQNLDQFTAALKSFKEGNFAGAIGDVLAGIINVFTDLGFNLLDLLGLTDLVGLSREKFTEWGLVVGKIIEATMGTAGAVLQAGLFSPIDDFIHITIPLLLSELERLGTKTAAAIPGNTEAQKQAQRLDSVDSYALGNIRFTGSATDGVDAKGRSPMEQFIEDVVLAGGDQTIRRLGTQAARDNALIYAQAVADFDWLGTLDAETRGIVQPQIIQDMVKYFQIGGVSDEILTQAVKGQDFGFLQALIEGMLAENIVVTPEMQAQLASSISEGFNLLDTNGVQVRLDNLDATIATFSNLELDTTQLQAERDRLQGSINDYLRTGEPPVADVPVTATPVITTTPPTDDPFDPASPNYIGKELFKDGAGIVTPFDLTLKPNTIKLDELDDNDILTVQAAAQGAVDKIPVVTPLVEFDAATLTDPTKVAEFNALIGTLITNIQTLGTELGGVASSTEPVTLALTEIQKVVTTFRDVTTPLFTEVGTAAATIGTAIRDIQNNLLALFVVATVGFPTMAASATLSIGAMAFQFMLLRSAADTHLNAVVNKVRELAGAFQDAALAASTLSNNPAFISGGGGGGGGGGSEGPGRAGGGFVRPGLLYPFLEKNKPELLQMGSETYLAVPRSGNVTALSGLTAGRSSGQTVAQSRGPLAAGAGGGTSIIIQEGDTYINISSVDPNNARQVADALKREQAALLSRSNVRLSDKLRNAHR